MKSVTNFFAKIANYVDANFSWPALVALTVVVAVLGVAVVRLNTLEAKTQQHAIVAAEYIYELEMYIEDNGGLMDTVGGGDAYEAYHNFGY